MKILRLYLNTSSMAQPGTPKSFDSSLFKIDVSTTIEGFIVTSLKNGIVSFVPASSVNDAIIELPVPVKAETPKPVTKTTTKV